MTKRTLASIVLIAIVLIEIISFLNTDTPTKILPRAEGSKSLFGATVIDKDAQSQRNTKYFLIIGATILLGGITIFSINNSEKSIMSSRKSDL
ncbi:hypothetical protein A8709_33065 [Paenibacillus pectinilyticus]|uniref:Protein-export membrane protein SecG n=1 Tax=Paenibacillus pectinilyticus TaxID=512399 RepID=A0A1C0ZWZ8_9BACL|nr:hypothetical protein [Paenibacillus pectinilyticus]OCT12643.1 hypothetical protein A8709_33065 [Paenibacillus pectinilyticus]